METATSFGGPFILIPKRLAGEWSKAIGDSPDPDYGLYGEVCQGEELMHLISFHGVTVVRIAVEPSDLFWVPADQGGLIVQWVGADSLDDLVAFGQKVAASNEWQEMIEFTVLDPDVFIMDSCGFDGDGQPKIDVSVVPGEYEISAKYAEDEKTMASVYRLIKKDQANKTAHPTAGDVLL
jgi:hypothetical protein